MLKQIKQILIIFHPISLFNNNFKTNLKYKTKFCRNYNQVMSKDLFKVKEQANRVKKRYKLKIFYNLLKKLIKLIQEIHFLLVLKI